MIDGEVQIEFDPENPTMKISDVSEDYSTIEFTVENGA